MKFFLILKKELFLMLFYISCLALVFARKLIRILLENNYFNSFDGFLSSFYICRPKSGCGAVG